MPCSHRDIHFAFISDSVVGHDDGSVDGVVSLPHPPQVDARSQTQAHGSDQKAAQVKEGLPSQREARGCQDSSERHDHHARDGRQHCWRLPGKNLQPGGLLRFNV